MNIRELIEENHKHIADIEANWQIWPKREPRKSDDCRCEVEPLKSMARYAKISLDLVKVEGRRFVMEKKTGNNKNLATL